MKDIQGIVNYVHDVERVGMMLFFLIPFLSKLVSKTWKTWFIPKVYIYISYFVFQTSPSDAITILGPLPQQGIAFRPKLRITSSHAPPVPARGRRKRLFGIYRPVTLFIVVCDRLHIRRRRFARRRDSSERAGLGREVSTRKLSAE